jgi:hypothetical protein
MWPLLSGPNRVVSINLAVSVFRVKDFEKGLCSSYAAVALCSMLEKKP